MRVSLLPVVAALLLGGTALTQTQTWNIDTNHTAAQFSVRHMGISTVRGAFTKLSGVVQFNAAAPEKTAIDASIDANSIDTRVEMRDNDLRSPNFFEVASTQPSLSSRSGWK